MTNQKRVLLVEDDKLIADLLEEALKRHGYEVTSVDDGELALEAVSASSEMPFDVILLDLLLPSMHGLEVLEKLKNDRVSRAIPVIVVSNLSDDQDLKKSKQLGAIDYMVKAHYTPEEMIARMESALAGNG
jgi:DNA-binding response OmpR family regulator